MLILDEAVPENRVADVYRQDGDRYYAPLEDDVQSLPESLEGAVGGEPLQPPVPLHRFPHQQAREWSTTFNYV